MAKLEERIEEGESYERRDTLVFSGKTVPACSTSENVSNLVCSLIKENLKINIQPQEISLSHRLGSKSTSQKPDNRPLIAKFCRHDLKTDILVTARKIKFRDFYVNECLTPVQKTISYVLREMKREFPDKIAGSTTLDGRNYAWIKPPRPDSPGAKNLKRRVSTRSELEQLCNNVLDKPLTHFLEEWVH